jgi:hypothetical protein
LAFVPTQNVLEFYSDIKEFIESNNKTAFILLKVTLKKIILGCQLKERREAM